MIILTITNKSLIYLMLTIFKHKKINQSESFISWKGRKWRTLIGSIYCIMYYARFLLNNTPRYNIHMFLNLHSNLVNLQLCYDNSHSFFLLLQTQSMLIRSDEVSDGVSKYMNSRARFKTLNVRREDYGRRQEKKEDETSK